MEHRWRSSYNFNVGKALFQRPPSLRLAAGRIEVGMVFSDRVLLFFGSSFVFLWVGGVEDDDRMRDELACLVFVSWIMETDPQDIAAVFMLRCSCCIAYCTGCGGVAVQQ